MEIMQIKKKIRKNKKNSLILKKLFLNEKNQLLKLELAHFLASFYWHNRCGVFQDLELEMELAKIASESDIFNENDVHVADNNNRTLHVATEVYSSGGHTRLINNWIKFQDDNENDLVILKPENSQIEDWLESTINNNNGKIILNNETGYINKAKFLYNLSKKYNKIILHILPNDIISMLAFSNPISRNKVYYLNHADHVFWLGITISKCILELTTEGKKLSHTKRGVINSHVINIPIEEFEKSEDDIQTKNRKIILSMATSHKFNNISNYDFFRFSKLLMKELSETEFFFIIIGPSLKENKWKKLYKESNGKIKAVGVKSKEELKDYFSQTIVYVDSFPFNSYTCLLEAITHKIYSVSLKTPISDLDATKDIKFLSEVDLIEDIINYLQGNKKINTSSLINNIKKLHYKDSWNRNLNSILSMGLSYIKPKAIKQSFTDSYECFFWEVQNKNLYLNPNQLKLIIKMMFDVKKTFKCLAFLVKIGLKNYLMMVKKLVKYTYSDK